LDGSGSNDSDGHLPFSYYWKQTGGPTVEIDDPFAATTIFTGSCTQDGVVTFTLTVTDNLDLASTPDSVTVTVENVPVDRLNVINSSPTILGHVTYFTATITDGSSVTYTWNFGDGDIGYSNDLDHVSHIAHTYGGEAITYTVAVTASNGFITGTSPAYQIYTDTATTTVTLVIAWPITGTVWDDTNDNSELDPGEPGLADIRMFLYREYSGCVAATTTDNNGVYTFTGVISGDYQVIEAYGHSSLGLSPIATFVPTEVVTPCNPAGLAADHHDYASNTPNVQWITLHDGGSIDNRAFPLSLWPASLTSVDFGDEQANSFSQCEDAFQTKGGTVGSIQLFKLDMLNAELNVYPLGSTTTYHDINSIGFNQLDNFIYGYRRDQDRFTRIDEDGKWTELTATDGFVTDDSYLGDIKSDEGYWVLGWNGHPELRIVDIDSSRPTYLMVVNTVMLNTGLVGADMAWNAKDDNFYLVDNDSQDLYRITFSGPLNQAGTSANLTHIADVMNLPTGTGGSGAQYFDKEGGFYFYPNNRGELYKISNVEHAGSQVTPTLIATGDTVNLNDGCGCAPTVEFEYGDAPASYEPVDKARHNFIAEEGIYLGSLRDGELEALNSPGALGDDNDNVDDEDGVTREGADWYDQALWANSSQFYTLTVYANKDGYLNVWFDLNGDGDWDDAGEQIADDLFLSTGVNYAPTFSVNDDYTGTTFVRFRFTDEIAEPVGVAGVVENGEVEDYLVTINGCADLALTKTVVPTEPVYAGQIVTFTVVVTNGGSLADCNDDASDVEVTDPLPSGYVYDSHDASQGVYSHTTGIWDVGTITHGVAVTLEIVAQVGGGEHENVAEVTDSGAYDPDSTPDNHWPDEDDQDSAAVELLPIGGTAYPVNKVAVLAPWIALAAIAVVIGGGMLLVKGRRTRQR
jgi:uncharacterized repeat protein (TIGR01451 family)